MSSTAPRPISRPLRALLAVALAASLLVITPRTAEAHDSCAIAQPVATGFLATVLSAVNVFSSIIEAEAEACPDKYGEVQTQLTRDWVAEPGVEDPFEPTAAAPSRGNAPQTFAPCIDGMAADFFACDGVDMLSHVSLEELGVTFVNDIWGWRDGRDEYALVGSTTGTVFVDITDYKRPEVLGIMPTASTAGGSSWRDIKVYEDHAFVVSEHTNHGVQVFDLTRLRDWDGEYTTYEPDARYTGHGSAHNININEDTGFAYSVGAGPFSSLPLPNTVRVDGVGELLANGAAFGPAPTQAGVSGDFAVVDDGTGDSLACGELVGFPEGAIAVTYRGVCGFAVKAANAQAAGASALVVINSGPGTITMGGADASITIPSVMVSPEDGAALVGALPTTGAVLANDPPAPCGDGLHMIDINDPTNPTYAGCVQEGGYVHDTQCVVYAGPDAEFRGREICVNSNGIEYALDGENYVSIVDVTDKANPVQLSRLAYEGSGYSHQGWMTEDQAYFLHGDEGDEILAGVNTTTRVWDISDLRNPEVINVFENDTTSIDHNLYTDDGGLAYASNYTTGLRVYDASDVATGIQELGYFDMYPENDDPTFEGGTWSNYPYLRQRNVVAVSSIDRGLFILRATLDDAPGSGGPGNGNGGGPRGPGR